MTLFLSSLFVFILFSGNAHAYMDPGSGSLLLQMIIGGLAGLAVTLKLYWGKIKTFFKGKSGKDE